VIRREDLGVIDGVRNCCSCVLRSVAGKRLLETVNPSACATVVGD
jgi:hypothetical protein